MQARNNAKAIAQETRDGSTAESDVRRKALEAELATKLAESEAVHPRADRGGDEQCARIAADAATAIVERLTGRAPERASSSPRSTGRWRAKEDLACSSPPEFWVGVSFFIFLAIVWKVGGFRTLTEGLTPGGGASGPTRRGQAPARGSGGVLADYKRRRDEAGARGAAIVAPRRRRPSAPRGRRRSAWRIS
jgi:hypothetical protein